jgi:hypothetical protein
VVTFTDGPAVCLQFTSTNAYDFLQTVRANMQPRDSDPHRDDRCALILHSALAFRQSEGDLDLEKEGQFCGQVQSGMLLAVERVDRVKRMCQSYAPVHFTGTFMGSV